MARLTDEELDALFFAMMGDVIPAGGKVPVLDVTETLRELRELRAENRRLRADAAKHERIPLIALADGGPFKRGDIVGYTTRAEQEWLNNVEIRIVPMENEED